MKTLNGFMVTLLLVGFITDRNLAQSSSSTTGTLLVMVQGFDNTEGELLVALYNEQEQFMDGTPTKGARQVIKASEELVTFENVPYGHYAVVVLQDLNKDSEMGKNCFGIPTEGYGFSNNAMGSYGPPSFEQASFAFANRYQTKIIDLHYGIPK